MDRARKRNKAQANIKRRKTALEDTDGADFKSTLNPHSLEVVTAKTIPAVRSFTTIRHDWLKGRSRDDAGTVQGQKLFANAAMIPKIAAKPTRIIIAVW